MTKACWRRLAQVTDSEQEGEDKSYHSQPHGPATAEEVASKEVEDASSECPQTIAADNYTGLCVVL
jgi:hypothetical protein